MLEKPTKWSNQNEGTCDMHHTAWIINGHHPKNSGDLVVRKVCFKTSGSKNCGYTKFAIEVHIRVHIFCTT